MQWRLVGPRAVTALATVRPLWCCPSDQEAAATSLHTRRLALLLPAAGVSRYRCRCVTSSTLVCSRRCAHARAPGADPPKDGGLLDVDEDELVRSLVQDALRPAARAAPSESATPARVYHPGREPRQHTGEAESMVDASSATTVATGASDDATESMVPPATAPLDTSPITDGVLRVRAGHAAWERFCRVRRTAHTHTVNSHKKLVDTEDALEWMCTQCQTFNFLNRGTCRHCGSLASESHRDKHPPMRHVVLFPSMWVCTGCGSSNSTAEASETGGHTGAGARAKFFCQHCALPFGGATDWCCPGCRGMNPRASTQCASCLRDRPAAWACGGCGCANNSIFSLTCRACDTRQSPILESDAVVRCATCAARNDVRWELCERCMAPLPAALAVVRGKPHRDSTAAGGRARANPPLPVTAEARPAGPAAASPAAEPEVAPREAEPSHTVATIAEEAEAEAEAEALPPQQLPAPSPRSSRSGTAGELDGSWWCAQCNVVQRRNAPFCDICLRPRDVAQATERPTREPGAWQCPTCRRYRSVTERDCCGVERQAAKGYWLCLGCGSTNREERDTCLGCGEAPPVRPWRCSTCRTPNDAGAAACATCGLASPATVRAGAGGEAGGAPLDAPVTCPVCHAPNAPMRRSCFRCRGRLHADGWCCGSCGTTVEDRHQWRCPSCRTPREFDTREEVWVCGVCQMAIASGGALPTRDQCPRCGSERASGPETLSFPSRWRCRCCQLYNWTTTPACVECGERRCVPGLQAVVHCPHCFRRTPLDSAETCASCQGSLSLLLTEAGRSVALMGRGMFAALQTESAAEDERGAVASGPPLDETTAAVEEVTADAQVPAHTGSDGLTGDGGEPVRDTEEELALAYMDEGHFPLAEEDRVADAAYEALHFPATWTCPRCDASNTEEYLACVRCSSPRP